MTSYLHVRVRELRTRRMVYGLCVKTSVYYANIGGMAFVNLLWTRRWSRQRTIIVTPTLYSHTVDKEWCNRIDMTVITRG